MTARLPGLHPGLTQALVQLPESVDHLQQRSRLRLGDGHSVEHSRAGGVGHEVDKLPAVGHARCDLESADVGSPRRIFIAHHSLLAVARVAARYVTLGALLAAGAWLHRKAGHRRAAQIRGASAAQAGGAR